MFRIYLSVIMAITIMSLGGLAQAGDKAEHFAAGATVGMAGMGLISADDPYRLRNTLLAGAALGLAKEARDKICDCGDPSAKDFLATALGTAVGAGAGLLIFPSKDGVNLWFGKSF